jgi:hypothetical protein
MSPAVATTVATKPTLPIKCRPVVKPAPADDGITVVFVSVVMVCVLNLLAPKASDPSPRYLACAEGKDFLQILFRVRAPCEAPNTEEIIYLPESRLIPAVDARLLNLLWRLCSRLWGVQRSTV